MWIIPDPRLQTCQPTDLVAGLSCLHTYTLLLVVGGLSEKNARYFPFSSAIELYSDQNLRLGGGVFFANCEAGKKGTPVDGDPPKFWSQF